MSSSKTDTYDALHQYYPQRNFSMAYGKFDHICTYVSNGIPFLGIGREDIGLAGHHLLIGLILFCFISNCSMLAFRNLINALFKSQRHFLSSQTIQIHRQLMKVCCLQNKVSIWKRCKQVHRNIFVLKISNLF